jgi:hypothetical protein
MCLTQCPVFLGVCAGNAVMPTSTCSSAPLIVSHSSMSGCGDEAGPAVVGAKRDLETSESAGFEPQRTETDKRAHVEPKGTLPNTLFELTCLV